MARQSLMWTALPNGFTPDGASLRMSVLLSPRLEPGSDPPTLASFSPDWTDWPAALAQATFEIRLGTKTVTVPMAQTAGPNRVGDVYGLPDSSIWTALFTPQLPVRGYVFTDLKNTRVLSYDTVAVHDLVRGLYAGLARTAGDDLPTVSALVEDQAWGQVMSTVDALDRGAADRRSGLRTPQVQFARFRDGGLAQEDKASHGLARFQLFHTPPHAPVTASSQRPEDSRITAKWLAYKRRPMPTEAELVDALDFHRIVAAMNPYQTMLRRLGLVVDFVLDPASFSAGSDQRLSVGVAFPAGTLAVPRARDVANATHTRLSANGFLAVPDPSLPSEQLPIAGGLARLDQRCALIQMDVDGAGLKLMNFARSLVRMKPEAARVDPVSRFDRTVGAPALRTAGLMLVHRGRSSMLEQRFAANSVRNTAVEKVFANTANAKPPEMWAEDLVRGYRLDIWDDGVWRSLCERQSTYLLGNGLTTVVPDAPEEGTVRLAATRAPDPAVNPDLMNLHEALVSWSGWSLVAPPPGRAVQPDDTVDKTTVTTDAVLPAGLDFRSRFTAVPGSLPRLRYGRRYWIRARAADLAGNSLPPSPGDLGQEKPTEHARPFLRYEPIMPPVLALLADPAGSFASPVEGESMDRLVVRTFNDTGNAVPADHDCWRMAVPPQVSVRDAELHGRLDTGGRPDPALFAVLATAKDRHPLTDPLAAPRMVTIPTKGPLDQNAVNTGFAVYNAGRSLTYLPDPLAERIAVRIFDHPNIAASEIIEIPLYASGAWPEALPFRIQIFGDESGKPAYDAASHTLRVPLPQAVRARLRLSVMPSIDAVRLLGVWSLLTPSEQAGLEKRIRSGQHWMLTPWRTVEAVHAVQRPLILPDLYKLQLGRSFRSTHVTPSFHSSCSLKSTDRLDLQAEWHEPQDRADDPLSEAAQVDRFRRDTAFTIKVTDPLRFATRAAGNPRGGFPDHLIEGEDRIAVGVSHDLVSTRIHEFHDTRYRRIEYWLEGTTRYREYLPTPLLAEDQGGTLVPVDDHVKVVGPRVATWVPCSAPPPAPAVLYVVPTFGWNREADQPGAPSSWRRGGGLRVYLDRPWNVSGYGEMLAVVLPPAGSSEPPDTAPKGHPYKNYVTQWGNDPIWLTPFVAGIAPVRSNFPLARTAPDEDGTWLPMDAPFDERLQRPGPFTVTGLLPPGVSSASPAPLLEVAPHDVQYDGERRLWFCDIEVRTTAYAPFIRLALARYQPIALTGAHLSTIVLADIMPLAADRWVNVTRTANPQARQVALYGPRYTDSSARKEAAAAPSMSVINLVTGVPETLVPASLTGKPVVEAWVEKLDPSHGEDFGWARVTSGVGIVPDSQLLRPRVFSAADRARAQQYLLSRRYDLLARERLVDAALTLPPIWAGTVTVPPPAEGRRYRLVIAEYEEYLVDDSRPYDPVPTKKGRRLVFVEHIELT